MGCFKGKSYRMLWKKPVSLSSNKGENPHGSSTFSTFRETPLLQYDMVYKWYINGTVYKWYINGI